MCVCLYMVNRYKYKQICLQLVLLCRGGSSSDSDSVYTDFSEPINKTGTLLECQKRVLEERRRQRLSNMNCENQTGTIFMPL